MSKKANITSGTGSGFIPNLHKLLSETSNPNLCWTSPTTFRITRSDSLAVTALATFNAYKTLAPFVRQLSYYEFKRLSDLRRRRKKISAAQTVTTNLAASSSTSTRTDSEETDEDAYISFSHPSGLFHQSATLEELGRIARKRRVRPTSSSGSSTRSGGGGGGGGAGDKKKLLLSMHEQHSNHYIEEPEDEFEDQFNSPPLSSHSNFLRQPGPSHSLESHAASLLSFTSHHQQLQQHQYASNPPSSLSNMYAPPPQSTFSTAPIRMSSWSLDTPVPHHQPNTIPPSSHYYPPNPPSMNYFPPQPQLLPTFQSPYSLTPHLPYTMPNYPLLPSEQQQQQQQPPAPPSQQHYIQPIQPRHNLSPPLSTSLPSNFFPPPSLSSTTNFGTAKHYSSTTTTMNSPSSSAPSDQRFNTGLFSNHQVVYSPPLPLPLPGGGTPMDQSAAYDIMNTSGEVMGRRRGNESHRSSK